MNPFEWLASPATQTKTNLQRLAELIAVNGKTMVITRCGKPVVDEESKYKRAGLTVPEGFELSYMRGCLEGIIKAHGPGTAMELTQACHDLLQQEMTGTEIVLASSLETKVFGS